MDQLAAPSEPYLTDEYEPTNPRLWRDVLDVAEGKRRQLTIGPRTINAPNEGAGFRNMPNNPNGIAWAVKQYNGFKGNWRPRKASLTGPVFDMLNLMRLGAVFSTRSAAEIAPLITLESLGYVKPLHSAGRVPCWDITQKGVRVVQASLKPELERRMDDLLTGEYDPAKAKQVADWLQNNFRFKSPKTPRGQKQLKEEVHKLWWALAYGGASYRATVEDAWSKIKPETSNLVRHFTDEGGVLVPAEKKVGSTTYLNKAGLDVKTLERYIKRIEQVLATVNGWRKKAFAGGLTVVFASPRDFNGTATGKYKSSEDAMLIRTTPSVLKRGAGYASFEYILIHELGHRYEYKNRLPEDFDKPHWHTTRYSRQDNESFAELFALGHFDLKGSWDQSVVERFEQVMGK